MIGFGGECVVPDSVTELCLGVSVHFFAADVVASLRPGGGRARLHVQSEDSPLLGRGVEDGRALDQAQLFELADHVIALALLEAGGFGESGHRSEALLLPLIVGHLEKGAADTHLAGT